MTEQDVTESLEPDEAMPEQIELEPAEALEPAETLEPIELDEPAETAETAEAFEEAREEVTSEEAPPPKPSQSKASPKARSKEARPPPRLSQYRPCSCASCSTRPHGGDYDFDARAKAGAPGAPTHVLPIIPSMTKQRTAKNKCLPSWRFERSWH